MKRNRFKFLKLLNKYRSVNSELVYVREVLKDAHFEFEDYYTKWCLQNNVDLQGLNKRNQRKVDMIFIDEKAHKMKQELATQEFGENRREDSKDLKNIFKSIAKKLHPDLLDAEDPRLQEYEEDFKIAAEANKNGKWGDLFDIVDKYKINLSSYREAIECLEFDLKRVTAELKKEKDTYSWLLFEAETEEEKVDVVKRFLNQIFGWRK